MKFNWKSFGEGLSWAFLALLCLSGTGLGCIYSPHVTPDGIFIGGFMATIGIIVFGVLLWSAYDWAWENKE